MRYKLWRATSIADSTAVTGTTTTLVAAVMLPPLEAGMHVRFWSEGTVDGDGTQSGFVTASLGGTMTNTTGDEFNSITFLTPADGAVPWYMRSDGVVIRGGASCSISIYAKLGSGTTDGADDGTVVSEDVRNGIPFKLTAAWLTPGTGLSIVVTNVMAEIVSTKYRVSTN